MSRAAVALGVVLACGGLVDAADSARLFLEPNAIYPGERAVLSVQLSGNIEDVTAIDIPAVAGLRIEGPYPARHQTSIVNGRTSTTTTYRYAVTAESATVRSYRIGPVVVKRSRGPVLRAAPVQFSVHKRPADALRFLREVARPAGTQLAPVLVRYTIEYAGERADERSRGGFFDRTNAFGLTKLELPIFESKELRVFPREILEGRRSTRLTLGDGRTVYVQESSATKEKGVRVRTLIFGFLVVPLRAGEIEIPAARVGMELIDGTEEVVETSPFGTRRRVQRPRSRQVEAQTQVTKYLVERPPTANRPPAYNDAVGRFSISVEATPTEVDMFAPITLSVRVKSELKLPTELHQALLENLSAPRWAKDPEMARDFDVSTDIRPGVVDGDTVVFTQKIRPNNAEVTSIPPVVFPYFDSETRRYETARSAPIPITVRAVETVDASDAIQRASATGGAGPAADAVSAPPGIFERGGIPANFAAIGRRSRSLDPRVELRSAPFLLSIIAPPLVFFIALLWRRRRRDPELAGRSKARTEALARLAGVGEDTEAAASAYQDFFRKRLGLGAGELTPADLRRALRAEEVPDALQDSAARLLEDFLSARFSGGGGGAAELSRRAVSSIKELSRCLS